MKPKVSLPDPLFLQPLGTKNSRPCLQMKACDGIFAVFATRPAYFCYNINTTLKKAVLVQNMNFKYEAGADDACRTVKSILKHNFRFSTKLVNKLKNNNRVFCNGSPVYLNHTVSTGDIVEAFIDFPEETGNIIPEKINLDILFEDDALIVLNKPAGIVVHPTSYHLSGTVANGLMHYFLEKNLHIKIRPVSRLDKDTTGVIVFAKNQFIQESLINQISEGKFKKEYIGIVHGIIKHPKGTINLPIARKPGSIMLRHISESGLKAVTHFSVQESLNNASLLQFTLETGRTHQIRVHCMAIGHPLFGDYLYSDVNTNLIGRQALHSKSISFFHPLTGKRLEVTSEIPSDIMELLEILRK
jgi:23S rRNA pseudouridine1911/1915/1917 synthase